MEAVRVLRENVCHKICHNEWAQTLQLRSGKVYAFLIQTMNKSRHSDFKEFPCNGAHYTDVYGIAQSLECFRARLRYLVNIAKPL